MKPTNTPPPKPQPPRTDRPLVIRSGVRAGPYEFL